jgi:hypothetical protein
LRRLAATNKADGNVSDAEVHNGMTAHHSLSPLFFRFAFPSNDFDFPVPKQFYKETNTFGESKLTTDAYEK